jgi:hypothetical protein
MQNIEEGTQWFLGSSESDISLIRMDGLFDLLEHNSKPVCISDCIDGLVMLTEVISGHEI